VNEPIIVVAGLGRCGTSLMMKMLDRGGIPVFCDNGSVGNSYESHMITGLPTNNEWLLHCYGKAVKILDPHIYRLPKEHNYRIIFLTRNFKQQALSQVKFLKKIALPGTSYMIRDSTKALARKYEKTMPTDQKRAMYACSSLLETSEHMLTLTFESIINEPLRAAIALQDFFPDRELNVMAMANAVIKRSPDCYEGFLELEFTPHE
jgi:hypothetical protein